jgi:hypothetical protein
MSEQPEALRLADVLDEKRVPTRVDQHAAAAELLAECEAAMGQVFTGYKGGDYVMGALTPLWVATYGCCGQKLMAVHAGGELETAEDE